MFAAGLLPRSHRSFSDLRGGSAHTKYMRVSGLSQQCPPASNAPRRNLVKLAEDGVFDTNPLIDAEGKLTLLRYARTPGECSE